ncbi:hypothetical protein BKA82DRAFT_122167 [Pisolithus tinctorius]|uniref:RING-type domain-containing protein n=1 Tax=Pisolithus tinctorius Marx 270 TaxID=870435 RepID=A0A0C3PWU6_PISTI|nr:hypothetical protein BKA82DRAFT_122167 [Pisolithus tinctorius]KIO13404.1 hypothetical protein M404DRAFT_122167 [Pisolithus tinctorius Marx 270]
MGNTGSSSGRPHNGDTVDYGYLTPQGVYTGPRDWNHAIVTQLIMDRKLAPFYRPLEEYNDDWDDEQILAARRDSPDSDHNSADPAARPDSRDGPKPPNQARRSSSLKEPCRNIPEAALYRGAVECPICFLYYPSNINHSRCCDQAICTECFVQIKRIEPTTTHLVSEPAACPYCVQDNFGIVYTPPPWRAGLGSEGTVNSPRGCHPAPTGSSSAQKRHRKSFGHDSPEVVTTDQIRPDWEAKLAAVRAAVARRANRRIVMRQVGDRLIPVGVTSGRVHTLPSTDGTDNGEGENTSGTGSRRRRGFRTNGPSDITQLLGQIGVGGQDLEELMVMEAMRLSLLEHEEHQKREEEKKRKEAAAARSTAEPPPEVSASAGPSTVATTASSTTSNSEITTLQDGDPGDSSVPRSRSLTPASGQTTRSSIRTVVDDLHDLSHSIEQPSTLGTLPATADSEGKIVVSNAPACADPCDNHLQTSHRLQGAGRAMDDATGYLVRSRTTSLCSPDQETPDGPSSIRTTGEAPVR